MQSILSIIGAIKALIDLFFWFRDMQAKERAKQAEMDRQELESAQDALEKAQTDEEIFEAQSRIARLKR
jgi:hypothetical protein